MVKYLDEKQELHMYKRAYHSWVRVKKKRVLEQVVYFSHFLGYN